MRRNSKAKGFTLVELIVVIAIIGILAAILIPSMIAYIRNARITRANANAKNVHTSAMAVAASNASSPSGGASLSDILGNNGTYTIGTGDAATVAALGGEFAELLGEGFTGHVFAKLTDDGYGYSYALWSESAITVTTQQYVLTQKENAKNASTGIIGCSPLLDGAAPGGT